MKKRRYTLKQRAESQEETRRRIVEATVDLHENVGPRDTTISAIAEKAGVQRLTVYRHFPDETELFKACTAHWLALNAPPEPASWSDRGGLDRVRQAVSSLGHYYRGTARMWAASYRDEPEVPALREPMRLFRDYLAAIAEDLATHLEPELEPTASRRATLSHAVGFSTWRSLAELGLDDDAIADLVCVWLSGSHEFR